MLHTHAAKLSRLMRHVNGVYTQHVSRRHGLVCHLLQCTRGAALKCLTVEFRAGVAAKGKT